MRKDTEMNVGIIGIGMLGRAISEHLLQEGIKIIIYNRTKEKTRDLENMGATIASSPKEVAEQSDLVITIVKDANAVNEISFGNDGIIHGLKTGTVVADMSTIEPNESQKIYEKFLEKGFDKIDIPVMGGPNVAISGNLVMMISGKKEITEKCMPVLEKIASKSFYLGSNPVAHLIKLAMNLQITMLSLALSEVITLVTKSNNDPKIFLEILNSTYFKTGMSENKAFKMIDGNYEPTFTLDNLKKDISTMQKTAEQFKIKLPMLQKAEEVFTNASNMKLGDLDYTGIIEYIKRINQ